MKVAKIVLIGVVIACILAGIFACINQKETDAYLTSVDAFIREVEE